MLFYNSLIKIKELRDEFIGITIYITDRANVAGNAVGADGLYLEKAGKLYSAAELNEVL